MKNKKIQTIVLGFIMLIATIDFAYDYLNNGELNLFYLGTIYIASGIALNVLKQAE